MDKAILKKFATQSRQDLMQKVESKIKLFYIDETFSKQQNGDVYVLSNDKHSLSLSKEEYDKRELLIKRINELGLEQVIEEAAYTWFNRIVAIRYMEINDYLPLTKDNQSLGIRVLSSKDNTPDPEIMKFTNLVNPDLDLDFRKETYAELKDDNEKFKYILLLVCKKLGKVIPQVFDDITDYIDILIPDNLLNDTGFVSKTINDVPESNFNQVEIIGWLYQYYNQTEKDRVISSKKAYKKNEIAYATQLFTPDWVVKYMVENSLGRYWIEHGGNKNIIENWKYFVNDEISIKQIDMLPTEIKCIDPCSGSGHILVYMFEILYQIYNSYGYSQNEIAELILKNNIYGLDIDDRAGQLSILSILLKAREYDKNIFNKNVILNLNIMSLQESSNIDSLIETLSLSEENKQLYSYLNEQLKYAKEIGSLLICENMDYSKLLNEIENDNTIFGYEIKNKIIPLIKEINILSNKYDIVITNPPYMTQTFMTKNLKEYINKKYSNVKNDMFSAFVIKNHSLLKPNCGYMGFMTPYVWMFISSYKGLREYILNNTNISSLIQMEYSALEEAVVPLCSFVLKNGENKNATFIRLTDFTGGMKVQEKKFLEIVKQNNKEYIYKRGNDYFLNIPEKIIAYWISETAIEKFTKFEKVGDYTSSSVGIQTGDNDKFLHYWWEVQKDNICLNASKVEDSFGEKKWFPYNKGGVYRKWYGNNENIIDWQNNGRNIINNAQKTGHHYQQYQDIYKFKPLITWSRITSGGVSIDI